MSLAKHQIEGYFYAAAQLTSLLDPLPWLSDICVGVYFLCMYVSLHNCIVLLFPWHFLKTLSNGYTSSVAAHAVQGSNIRLHSP